MGVVWVGHGHQYLAWWGGCGQGIPLSGVKAGAGGVRLGPWGEAGPQRGQLCGGSAEPEHSCGEQMSFQAWGMEPGVAHRRHETSKQTT